MNTEAAENGEMGLSSISLAEAAFPRAASLRASLTALRLTLHCSNASPIQQQGKLVFTEGLVRTGYLRTFYPLTELRPTTFSNIQSSRQLALP